MVIQLLKNKENKRFTFRKLLYLFICFAGALTALFATLFIQKNKDVYSFSSVPYGEYVSLTEREIPVRITIPSLSLSLRVDPASVSNNSWPVSEEFANYLAQSSSPGAGSNIVIYGHNKATIFGRILTLKEDDIIILNTESEKEYTYIIKEIHTVLPTAVEFIQPTKTEMLTLYTCVGLFDSRRLIIRAEPI